MFKLVSDYKPTVDQPKAIEYLSNGIKEGKKFQTLLGVTGSGKTFTMANIISSSKANIGFTIIKHSLDSYIPNSKSFSHGNNVEYFVS